MPDATIRTSLIVGFPGETQAQFEHLVSFVEHHQFDHVGVFTFSAEEGTKAHLLDHQVPSEIALARNRRIEIKLTER